MLRVDAAYRLSTASHPGFPSTRIRYLHMKFALRSILAFTLLVSSLFAFAGEQAFDRTTFDTLRAAGKPVVVHVHAPWCPVCKKQAEVISSLESDARFKDVTVMRVDFDTEKDVQRTLDVKARSTLVAFKGNTEVGRSTGETNRDRIAALFSKTLP